MCVFERFYAFLDVLLRFGRSCGGRPFWAPNFDKVSENVKKRQKTLINGLTFFVVFERFCAFSFVFERFCAFFHVLGRFGTWFLKRYFRTPENYYKTSENVRKRGKTLKNDKKRIKTLCKTCENVQKR